MKHKTWFRLVIKSIGLLLLALSVRDLVALIVGLTAMMLRMAGMSIAWFPQFNYNWPYYAGGVAQGAIGAYLFFGGRWIVNRCIPSNRPYCPDCGYDLSHHPASARHCTECGIILPPPIQP